MTNNTLLGYRFQIFNKIKMQEKEKQKKRNENKYNILMSRVIFTFFVQDLHGLLVGFSV